MLIGPIIQNLVLFRAELIQQLLHSGYEVSIVSSINDKESVDPAIKIINVDIDRRGTSVINDIKLIKHYYDTLKENRPDIVLTYTTKCSVYGGIACRICKIPYVVNNSGLYNKEDFSQTMWVILNLLYKIGYRGSSCMMYQNTYERDKLNEILNHKVRFRDIPGSGVSLTKFKYCNYPDTSDKIIFNYVARIVDIKGIKEYLECAKIIKEKYPNASFRILGSYDDESYIEKVEHAEQLGYVEYMGPQKNMLPFIETCHAVIHPSHYEGMTNVVLEHSAVGRVCIASDIPGCREGIEEGVTGYLFEKKNVSQLVDVVEKFILLPHEKKEEMGRLAHEKMLREFDRNIVTNIYMHEIERICKSKK